MRMTRIIDEGRDALGRVAVAASVLSGLIGCGTDSGASFASPEDDGPLYVINSNVFSSDFSTTTSYLAVVGRLDRGSVTLRNAVEFPGGISLWGIPTSGEFYVVSAEELTVTKFEVPSSRVPKEIGRLGIAGRGITRLYGEVMVFDTSEAPLTADRTGRELYASRAWDTRRIDLTNPVSLESIERASVAGGIKFFEVDGEVYENDSAANFSETTLVRTTTDAVSLVPGLRVPGVPFGLVRVR